MSHDGFCCPSSSLFAAAVVAAVAVCAPWPEFQRRCERPCLRDGPTHRYWWPPRRGFHRVRCCLLSRGWKMTWTQHEDALVALWPSLNETPSPGVTTNMLRWEPFEVASSIFAGHEASAVSTCSKSDMTDLMPVPGPVARFVPPELPELHVRGLRVIRTSGATASRSLASDLMSSSSLASSTQCTLVPYRHM